MILSFLSLFFARRGKRRGGGLEKSGPRGPFLLRRGDSGGEILFSPVEGERENASKRGKRKPILSQRKKEEEASTRDNSRRERERLRKKKRKDPTAPYFPLFAREGRKRERKERSRIIPLLDCEKKKGRPQEGEVAVYLLSFQSER